MDREKAEQTVGSSIGEKKPWGVSYENGVQLTYRENKVVGIDLSKESLDHYRTARGAQIGMTREEVIALYGGDYMKLGDTSNLKILDYYYDSEREQLLTEPTPELMTGTIQHAERFYLVSSSFGSEETAELISIMDRRRATSMD